MRIATSWNLWQSLTTVLQIGEDTKLKMFHLACKTSQQSASSFLVLQFLLTQMYHNCHRRCCSVTCFPPFQYYLWIYYANSGIQYSPGKWAAFKVASLKPSSLSGKVVQFPVFWLTNWFHFGVRTKMKCMIQQFCRNASKFTIKSNVKIPLLR